MIGVVDTQILSRVLGSAAEPDPGAHYLHRELYSLACRDRRVFDFFEAHLLDGLWFIDLTVPHEEWLSPGFRRAFGPVDRPSSEATSWRDHVHAADRGRLDASLDAARTDPEQSFDEVVRYHGVDGSIVWIRCQGIVVQDGFGLPSRILAAHTDVSASKRVEAELAMLHRDLQRADQERRLTATTVTHDICAPVRNILAFDELLRDEVRGQLSDDAALYLHHISTAARDMKRMIGSFVRLLRLGDDAGAPRRVELDVVLDHAVSGLTRQMEESKATVTRSPLPAVTGQQTMLLRVFHELLDNALKFRGQEAPTIDVRASVVDDLVEVTVADRGIGIDTANAERVFQPFRQLHPHGLYPGDGMGLTFCRKAIELQGGTIGLESLSNAGTTVRFTVPGCAEVDR